MNGLFQARLPFLLPTIKIERSAAAVVESSAASPKQSIDGLVGSSEHGCEGDDIAKGDVQTASRIGKTSVATKLRCCESQRQRRL